MEERSKLNALPDDCLLEIFGYLPQDSLMNIALVNKRFHELVTTDSLAGRHRLTNFVAHHICRHLVPLISSDIKDVGIEKDNSQFIHNLVNEIEGIINNTLSDPSSEQNSAVIDIIVQLISDPDKLFEIFPKGNMPDDIAHQFQKINQLENRRETVLRALRYLDTHRYEIARRVNQALRNDYFIQNIKQVSIEKILPAIVTLLIVSAVLAIPILIIIFSPKNPNDPNDPNYDYDDRNWKFYDKCLSDYILPNITKHATLSIVSSNAWLEKYGDTALIAALGASTVATATVAAVTAGSAVAVATAGGLTTVAVASNPAGWIAGTVLLGTSLIFVGVQFAWNYSRDAAYSLSDFCKLSRKGKVQKILNKYESSFDVNQISSFASCGIIEARLGRYSPLALAAAYGQFTTVVLLVEYYHANPNLLVGRENNLNALDIAKRKYSFFTSEENNNKIVKYLESRVSEVKEADQDESLITFKS